MIRRNIEFCAPAAWGSDGSTSDDTGAASDRVSTLEIVAIAVGVAVIGGLGVWLSLRAGSNPQHRISQRIEELRHRMSDLADQLTGYASGGQGSGSSAGGS